jgi:hypothetical protein
MFRLVALAHCTRTNKVLHHTIHVREVEVVAESVQRALDALMALLMDRPQHLLHQR